MNENYEQKPQTLKDFDEEDENILALQNNINNLINVKNGTSDNYFDDVEETEEDLQTPIQFSVNLKVERVHGESGQRNCGGESVNPTNSRTTENSSSKTTEIINIDSADNNEDSETYYLRKVLPHCKNSKFVPVKQYFITKETILKAIEVQSKQNTTHIDKYLDIATRNFHGEYKISKKSFHDQLIHDALEKWYDWYSLCPGFRNSPFIYICCICQIGWWRLRTFREHIIKEHKDPNLKIATDLKVHEFSLLAYTDITSLKNRKVTVNSNCWKCGKSANYHAIRKKTSKCKYRCQVCPAEFMTCTKLLLHESICKQYIEMMCKELRIDAFGLLECFVCHRKFINQIELDVHMTECHSVRSDEPAFVKLKYCNTCCGNFHDFKYHDCPKRSNNIKCDFCFRKFTTRVFQELHMQSNKGTFNCVSCGESMRECMAMEHLVQHTKNYTLLYRCVKCTDNILYDKDVYFKNHMKLHERWVDRRRWGTMVLLPIKSINGEIVKSEITLYIHVKDFNYFINGLPNKPDLNVNMVRLYTLNEEDQDKIILDDDSQRLHGTEKQVEFSSRKPEYDDYALQARLDAEIQRDVEMEAAISRVFSASNAYQKLLKKETEESEEAAISKMISSSNVYPKLLKKETEESEEAAISKIISSSNVYQNFLKKESEEDLIIIEQQDEVTIISDSDSEEDNVKMEIEQSVKEEQGEIESKEVGELNLNNKTANQEEADCATTTVLVKEEAEKSDITLTVEDIKEFKKEEEHLNNKTVIKEEPETLDIIEINVEPDLIDTTKDEEETEMSHDEDDEIPLGRLAKPKCRMLQCYNDDNEVIVAGVLQDASKSDQHDEESEDSSSVDKATVYKCTECMFQGDHKQYIEHVTISCNSLTFFCSSCSKLFPNLKLYTKHLTVHKYKKLSCPECGKKFRYLSMLCAHIKKHLNRLCLLVPNIENLPVISSSAMNYVFKCKKCLAIVDLGNFFNHWESHLEIKVKEEEMEEYDNSPNDSDIEESIGSLDPDVLKEVLEALIVKEKCKTTECVVCGKKFKRKDECKRHLIEHLYVDALLKRNYNKDQLRCQLCNMNTRNTNNYKHHMRKHALLHLYTCDLCCKGFSDSSNYAKHRKVHNEFSYICDLCGAKFHSKKYLVIHLKVHETSSLRCEECDLIFHKESILKKHNKIKHSSTPYTCKLCDRRFKTFKAKWVHLWVNHGIRKGNPDCPICDKPYRTITDVKKHIREIHLKTQN